MSVIDELKHKLSQIAKEENGEYSYEDGTAVFADGSRCPESYYHLKYFYKETHIEMFVETGLVQSTRITCNLSTYLKPIDFRIECLSPFINLFLRKKSRFKVICPNEQFKRFLANDALSIFNEIINSKNFDPRIYSNKENSKNQIIFVTHLAFPNWVEIFDKINEFLKLIIDELDSDNRYISNRNSEK